MRSGCLCFWRIARPENVIFSSLARCMLVPHHVIGHHRATCDHHGRASRAAGGFRGHHVSGSERLPEHATGSARTHRRRGAVSSSRIQSSGQDLGAGLRRAPQFSIGTWSGSFPMLLTRSTARQTGWPYSRVGPRKNSLRQSMAWVNWPLVCSGRSMSKITEGSRDHIADESFAFPKERKEIGRASCRERV